MEGSDCVNHQISDLYKVISADIGITVVSGEVAICLVLVMREKCFMRKEYWKLSSFFIAEVSQYSVSCRVIGLKHSLYVV